MLAFLRERGALVHIQRDGRDISISSANVNLRYERVAIELKRNPSNYKRECAQMRVWYDKYEAD